MDAGMTRDTMNIVAIAAELKKAVEHSYSENHGPQKM